MISYLAQLPIWTLPLLGLVALVIQLGVQQIWYGVVSIPGPFWASCTDLWRLFDVDTFRPKRWLEDSEKASGMNRFLFSFGGGARTCISKNISYLEMFKLVPAVLRTFDVSLH